MIAAMTQQDSTRTPFPANLSASRANDFLTCPLLFRYRSIDRLPEVPSAAALRGTLVHRALEVMFGLPAGRRSLQAASSALATAWSDLASSDPDAAVVLMTDAGLDPAAGTESGDELGTRIAAMAEQVSEAILAPASGLLSTYFHMEDPTRFDPHAMEMGFEVPLADAFSIRGFVDRVDIAPTGEVRIVDYKTGRAPSSGFEGKAMFQMRFYALAWWRMTGQIPRMLRLMYLGSGEALTYAPEASDLLATERKVLALRDAIAASAQEGTFAAKVSRLCDWCSFRDRCPAWGSVPLPMPTLPTAAEPMARPPAEPPEAEVAD